MRTTETERVNLLTNLGVFPAEEIGVEIKVLEGIDFIRTIRTSNLAERSKKL